MVNEAQNLGDANRDRETEHGFTPGPWSLTNDGTYIRPDCLHGKAPLSGPTLEYGCWPAICSVRPWPQDRWDRLGPEESRANARLIVAAPDLYAALKETLDVMEIQEQRESEDFHLHVSAFRPMWDKAKADACAALMLARNESAMRPISDDQQHGQASDLNLPGVQQ